MKHKRLKSVRKVISFYRNHFNLSPPYKVLADGTFCCAALSFKLNIKDQIKAYIGEDVKLYTTLCVLAELEKLGKAVYGGLVIAKQYAIHKCPHKDPISAAKCLIHLLKSGEMKPYIVATQDPIVSEVIRTTPGTPLLYIAHRTILLERPSQCDLHRANHSDTSKIVPNEQQRKTLKVLKEKEQLIAEPVQKKRRKKGGPNPLSCKKKKVKKPTNSSKESNQNEKTRKRRKRTKKPKTAGNVQESS